MNKVIVVNPAKLEETKKAMAKDGADKLHILTDFDGTLTKKYVNGEKVPSLISILRDEGYLTPDYPDKAKAFAKKYKLIEDSEISLKEKKKAMSEWWTSHYELLIKSKLHKRDIEKAVLSKRSEFKKGALNLIDLLSKQNIPLVVMSATGLGVDSLKMRFERDKINLDNICLVSNSFQWSDDGYLLAINEPVVHSANKDETVVKDFPEVYKKIKDRKNVILLGDSDGDAEMITGFDYDNLIKIGFLNKMEEKQLAKFEEIYDVVIIGDDSAEYVAELMKEIFWGGSWLTFNLTKGGDYMQDMLNHDYMQDMLNHVGRGNNILNLEGGENIPKYSKEQKKEIEWLEVLKGACCTSNNLQMKLKKMSADEISVVENEIVFLNQDIKECLNRIEPLKHLPEMEKVYGRVYSLIGLTLKKTTYENMYKAVYFAHMIIDKEYYKHYSDKMGIVENPRK